MSKIKRQTVPDEKKQSRYAVTVSRSYHKTALLRWFSNGGVRLAEGILQLSSEWCAFGLDCPGKGVERDSTEWSFFGLGYNWFGMRVPS